MWSIEKDLIGGKDMFQFETQLKKLKHEVLTEVAKQIGRASCRERV